MAEKDAPTPYSLLVVDDEQDILGALRRLFEELEHTTVHTAASSEEAARILKSTEVDVLLSDERMPGIKGHKLLEFAKEHYPETVRIVLTGYSDSEAMRAAVNRGEVYRYLFKPWDDDELLVTVENALRHARAERERQSVTEELRRVNAELEAQVQERTRELEAALSKLKEQHKDTESTLHQTMLFLGSVMSIIDKGSARGSMRKRTAQLASRIASKLEMSRGEVNLVVMASYFIGIGSVAAGKGSDAYMTDEGVLNTTALDTAEHLIESVLGFHSLGNIVRHVAENFNGSGTPDGIAGEEIPMASRIVRFAIEYQHAKQVHHESDGDVITRMKARAGTFYDPRVLESAESLIPDERDSDVRNINIKDIAAGMTLAEDVVLDNGIVFVASGTKLTNSIVSRIQQRLEQSSFPLHADTKTLVYRAKE